MPDNDALRALRLDGRADSATPQNAGDRLECHEASPPFTTKPCRNGHISERYPDGSCSTCARLRAKRRRAQQKQERTKPGPYKRMHIIPTNRPQPSAEAIAEAMRAYSAPREPFAEMLGDPPPGRSALDRKRMAGVV